MLVSTPVLLEMKKKQNPANSEAFCAPSSVGSSPISAPDVRLPSVCRVNSSLELPPNANATLMGTTVSSQHTSSHQILNTTRILSPACRRGLCHARRHTHRCPCVDANGSADWEAPWNMNNNHPFCTWLCSPLLRHLCLFLLHPSY